MLTDIQTDCLINLVKGEICEIRQPLCAPGLLCVQVNHVLSLMMGGWIWPPSENCQMKANAPV